MDERSHGGIARTLHIEVIAVRADHLKKVLKCNSIGGIPGTVPGKIVCGQISARAVARITGGILIKVSSSLGNLNRVL